MGRKTKQQIIQETYDYYSADPNGRRAINIMGCYYIMEDGRMCAVGRCMISPQKDDNDKGRCSKIEDLESRLKEEYRGNDIQFWKDLQNFHDWEGCWNKETNTISEKGREKFELLMKTYADTVS